MSSDPATLDGVTIEDDLDADFDDLLDQFDPKSLQTATPDKKSNLNPLTVPTSSTGDPSVNLDSDRNKSKSTEPDNQKNLNDHEQGLSDEFVRDLAEGMEALLAGIKDQDGGELEKRLEALVQNHSRSDSSNDNQEHDDLNQFLSALNKRNQKVENQNQSKSQPESNEFQSTVKDTLEKLKQSDDFAKAGNDPPSANSEDEQLASLLEQMMASEGGLPDEKQLQTMLQSFMEELMSKEIMYEPLKDMNRLYPDWISNNRSKLSPGDLQRYQTQSQIVSDVVKKFEHPTWDAEEKAGGERFAARQKEVIDLLTMMQDCGPPPKEIIGEMPPGLLGDDKLPNPEQCNVC